MENENKTEEVVEKTPEEIALINKICDNIKVEVEPESPKDRFLFLLGDFCKKIEDNLEYLNIQVSAQEKMIAYLEGYIKKNKMQKDVVAFNDELKQKSILLEKLKEAKKVEQARYTLYKSGFINALDKSYDFIKDINVFFKDAIGLDDFKTRVDEINGK